MLIKNEKYQEVLDIIRTIHNGGKNDVMFVIKKIRCDFELQKNRRKQSANSTQHNTALPFPVTSTSYHTAFSDVTKGANELTCLLEFTEKIEHLEECCIDLEYVVENLIMVSREIKKVVQPILLRALFTIFKNCFKEKEKLAKLQSLGVRMQCLLVSKQQDHDELCEDVLSEMQMVGAVAAEEKCLLIAQFLFDVHGTCSCEKSIEMAKQTIFLLKSVLGRKAADHQIFGRCHLKIGDFQVNQISLLLKAQNSFEEANKCFAQAKDWDNLVVKAQVITETRKKIRNVKVKMENHLKNQR